MPFINFAYTSTNGNWDLTVVTLPKNARLLSWCILGYDTGFEAYLIAGKHSSGNWITLLPKIAQMRTISNPTAMQQNFQLLNHLVVDGQVTVCLKIAAVADINGTFYYEIDHRDVSR